MQSLKLMIVAAVTIVAMNTATAENFSCRQLGSLPYDWGEITDLVIEGNYAYLVDAADAMRIIDVSNSARPVEVGKFHTEGQPTCITYQNGVVYLGGASIGGVLWDVDDDWTRGGVIGIDVTDAGNPREMFFNQIAESPTCLLALNDVLFVGNSKSTLRDSTLYAFDIGFSDSMQYLASVNFHTPIKLLATGNRVLQLSQNSVSIFSFSNDRGLERTMTSNMNGSYHTCSIANRRIYAGGYNHWFNVLDMNQDNFPQIAEFRDLPDNHFNDVTVIGNRAIVSGYGWNRILDVSDLQHITVVDSLPTANPISAIRIDNDIAYVAAKNGGLEIYDVANIDNAELVGSLNHPGFTTDVLLNGHYAYLANGRSIQVVDVDNPAEMFEVNAIPNIYGEYMALRDTILAVTWNGTKLYNVAEAVNPILICTINNQADSPPAIYGDLLVQGQGNQTDVYSIAHPERPALISTIPIGSVSSVMVGDRLYLACEESGLTEWDLTRPASPRMVGRRQSDASANKLIRYGDNLIVGWGQFSFGQIYAIQLFDISEPDDIRDLAYMDIHGGCSDFQLRDTLLYIPIEPNAIELVSIADPSNPHIIGELPLDTALYYFEVTEDFIFGTDGDFFKSFEYSFEPNTVKGEAELPFGYSVSEPFPNPSNAAVTIGYELPEAAAVTISLIDLNGKCVEAILSGGVVLPGRHSVNVSGRDLPAGVYLCRVQVGEQATMRKIVFVK